GALFGEKRRRGRTRGALHDSDRLRDWSGRPDVALCRHSWHRQYRGSKAAEAAARTVPAAPHQYPPRFEAQPANLPPHGRLRPFRPRAGEGRRILVGTNRSCGFAQARFALSGPTVRIWVVPSPDAFAIPRRTENMSIVVVNRDQDSYGSRIPPRILRPPQRA